MEKWNCLSSRIVIRTGNFPSPGFTPFYLSCFWTILTNGEQPFIGFQFCLRCFYRLLMKEVIDSFAYFVNICPLIMYGWKFRFLKFFFLCVLEMARSDGDLVIYFLIIQEWYILEMIRTHPEHETAPDRFLYQSWSSKWKLLFINTFQVFSNSLKIGLRGKSIVIHGI